MMKHCRKCTLIYDEEVDTCERCKGGLKGYEPGHKIHKLNITFPEGAKWAVLESMQEEYVAQFHVDYLKSRHVPAIKILNQESVLSKVYLGNASSGYDVFVPESILKRARELLDEYLSAEFDETPFKEE